MYSLDVAYRWSYNKMHPWMELEWILDRIRKDNVCLAFNTLLQLNLRIVSRYLMDAVICA